MKNKFILTLLPIVLLSSCMATQNNDDNYSVSVTDGIGRKVELNPSKIKKIVCVGAGALRYYAYLEGAERLVGVEDIDNENLRTDTSPFSGVARPYYDAYKDLFSSLQTVGQGGPMHQSPELEKLAACSPDLIISDYETEEQASKMEEVTGAKVFTVKYGSKGVFDDNFSTTLKSLGTILDKSERASELVTYIDDCKEEIIKSTSNLTKDKNVYIGGIGNWGQKDYLSTNPKYYPFQVANINNVLENDSLLTAGVQNIDKEKFASIANNIDIMVLDCAGISKTIEAYKIDSTIFDSVKAIQNNEVYISLPFNAYYQNIEIDLINTYYFASITYPNCFGNDFNIETKADEILEKFVKAKIYLELKSMKGQYGGYQKIKDFRKFLESDGKNE